MLSTVSVDGPSRKRRGRTPKEKPVNKKEPAEFEDKIFVEYLSSDRLQEVILAKKVGWVHVSNILSKTDIGKKGIFAFFSFSISKINKLSFF